ncbi:MAG: peroxiredoxin family protein [Duncaniella sp.]|nr:peroxiredoxin family protein [Duncaniella sp.]MDE6117993.1 peroxiredoxin family protein [Duncaniella sp.]MDE7146329.1 peroxiredoxin family protein [Duncaniella sp.]
MKKALSYIAFFGAIILLVSAYSERVIKAEKGYTAPEIEMVSNDSTDISLDKLRGKYVLVNFWDSGSAISRIAAGEYDRFLRNSTDNNFKLLSINTDENKNLFHEIVKNDNLDTSTQFHIGEVKTKNTKKDYRLEQGFSSYLIDPQGKIVAVNPSVTTLEKYLTGK